jgi:putative ABC transport system permease protein
MTARMIVEGFDPLLATLCAIGAGVAAGMVTGILHTALKIPPLLSGIITMTGMYSINLRVMGRANIGGLRLHTTLLSRMADMLGTSNMRLAAMGLGVVVLAVVILTLWLFFNTELGCALRATGNNEHMVRAQGVNVNAMKITGLCIGNACVALSGAMVCQYNGSADINMGMGTIVIGLAALIIGEVLFRDSNNHRIFYAVVCGCVIYYLLRMTVLALGLPTQDFRLISSLLLTAALSLPLIREKLRFDWRRLLLGKGGA